MHDTYCLPPPSSPSLRRDTLQITRHIPYSMLPDSRRTSHSPHSTRRYLRPLPTESCNRNSRLSSLIQRTTVSHVLPGTTRNPRSYFMASRASRTVAARGPSKRKGWPGNIDIPQPTIVLYQWCCPPSVRLVRIPDAKPDKAMRPARSPQSAARSCPQNSRIPTSDCHATDSLTSLYSILDRTVTGARGSTLY